MRQKMLNKLAAEYTCTYNQDAKTKDSMHYVCWRLSATPEKERYAHALCMCVSFGSINVQSRCQLLVNGL